VRIPSRAVRVARLTPQVIAEQLLSLLLAAVVAWACVTTAAHGFGAEPDPEHPEVHAAVVGALGLVELDEEQETIAPSLFVTLAPPRATSSLGVPALGPVGPSRGHTTPLKRPPSAA
jgi:hypothetical protein